MASLQGLPPLPKSLSGLLSFSSAQWKEMERIHAMKTMIQQDLTRSQQQPPTSFSLNGEPGLDPKQGRKKQKFSLDAQLALLRKEMVGLRQLDMSLLCQLWSLNESIQECKQMTQERLSISQTSSPGWDNCIESSCDDEAESPDPYEHRRRDRGVVRDLKVLPELLSLSSTSNSSSRSSLEFGDI